VCVCVWMCALVLLYVCPCVPRACTCVCLLGCKRVQGNTCVHVLTHVCLSVSCGWAWWKCAYLLACVFDALAHSSQARAPWCRSKAARAGRTLSHAPLCRWVFFDWWFAGPSLRQGAQTGGWGRPALPSPMCLPASKSRGLCYRHASVLARCKAKHTTISW